MHLCIITKVHIKEYDMLINLSELFPVEGKSRTYTVPLEMTSFHAADGDYEIVEKEPVTLTVTNEGNKVFTVIGEAALTLSMVCARCLEPVRVSFNLVIDQEVDMKQTGEDMMAKYKETSKGGLAVNVVEC